MRGKRKPMTKRHSGKLFRRTASMTHKKNMPRRAPMRGGIRL